MMECRKKKEDADNKKGEKKRGLKSKKDIGNKE